MHLSEWLPSEMSSVIGWTILHSLWQSLLLLIILKALLPVVGIKRSGARYTLSLSFLSIMLLITFFTIRYELHASNALRAGATHPAVIPANSHLPESLVADSAPGISGSTDEWGLYPYITGLIPYLTLGWMLGMLLYAGKLLRSSYYLKRLRREPPCDEPAVIQSFRVLYAKMGIRRPVSLLITTRSCQPMTFGFLKAVIVLPLQYVTQAPADQLEMILAHELSHIKRWDYPINICQSALEAIYFFNPFFRSLSDTIRTEREYCCDDMAAETCGDKRTMAVALTQLKILTHHPRLSLSASPVKKAFYERVYRLVTPSPPISVSVKGSLIPLCMTAGVLLLLAQCKMDNNISAALPGETDSINQLWQDNQAGHKVELLSFGPTGKEHEMLLVSTIEAKPLYAYIDGLILKNDKLNGLYHFASRKNTLSETELSNARTDRAAVRIERTLQLQREMDSLNNRIINIESASVAKQAAGTGAELMSLKDKLQQKTGEVKALSMARYNEEAREIPIDVKLHDLVTRIIEKNEYTLAERRQLNQLIRQKLSI